MRKRQLTLMLSVMLLGHTAGAQIVPHAPPSNTELGGSGAAEAALVRTGLERKTIGSMEGPATGGGRSRHEIQTFAISDTHVPGVKEYYLRSSYVVLEPGGLSPLHPHARRPAFLQVISGEVSQHRSDGLSLLMGPGDFTFSSDSVVHWWVNESQSEPMRLWIVELCTEKHGCDKVVEEGATGVSMGGATHNTPKAPAEVIMAIDLAGEFPDVAPRLGQSELRLRRIEIAPGDAAQSVTTAGIAYLRVHSGSLSVETSSGSQQFAAGSVLFSESKGSGSWSSADENPVVVYAVDITPSRGE